MIVWAVSDVVWQALIGAAVTIILAYMARRTQKAVETAAKDAAVKVDEVKETLDLNTTRSDRKMDDIARVGAATHTLVNSAMGAQLKLHAETARAKADITGEPGEKAVADLAERMLADHVRKQASVDEAAASSGIVKEAL